MRFVVAFDLGQGGSRFLERGECEEPAASGNDRTEAGVLHNDWASGGEITGRPATEPARLATRVAILGDTPFAARPLDVVPVRVHRRAHGTRVSESPARGFQQVSR